jgi:hypothetical protein
MPIKNPSKEGYKFLKRIILLETNVLSSDRLYGKTGCKSMPCYEISKYDAIISRGDKMNNPMIKLAAISYMPHQEKVKETLTKDDTRGVLAYHGLGSGKTLTAILSAEKYGGAVVIVPASLRENFRKELRKANARGRYDIYSYEEFARKKPTVTGRMVILDEAHKIRTSSSQRSQVIRDLTKDAKKILLLSATPIQNKPHEIAPLINTITGTNTLPLSESDFNNQYIQKIKHKPNFFARVFLGHTPTETYKPKNLQDFSQRTSGLVSYYSNDQKKDDFPSVTEKDVRVPMSREQESLYNTLEREIPRSVRQKIQSQLPPGKSENSIMNYFINATRQVSNVPSAFMTSLAPKSSPKIQAIADKVSNDPRKSLVYSNYLDGGLNPLATELTKRGVPFAMYTGSLSDRDKLDIVNKYNNDEIKSLLVSSSGGEGLDLKNTGSVHIMEPHWNSPKIDQVKGRAVRYRSHETLPPEERKVDIYNYLSVRRKGKPTADEYLATMSQNKKALNDHFLSILRGNSI